MKTIVLHGPCVCLCVCSVYHKRVRSVTGRARVGNRRVIVVDIRVRARVCVYYIVQTNYYYYYCTVVRVCELCLIRFVRCAARYDLGAQQR